MQETNETEDMDAVIQDLKNRVSTLEATVLRLAEELKHEHEDLEKLRKVTEHDHEDLERLKGRAGIDAPASKSHYTPPPPVGL